jgi:pimeloyl-ACP methyl ester carboxylesterase
MEFILVPGAWAGGWLWDGVAHELRKKRHETHQLTLSGLDGKSDPGNVRLKTHVEDVRSYIASRDIHSVVLVGHSYSGLVVGQVASQYPNLIDHTIFVEAYLPVAGRSLLEVSGLDVEEERAAIASNQGHWPAPLPEDLAAQTHLSDAQVKLLLSKHLPHPGATVTDPAELALPLKSVSASFIAHQGWLSGSREQATVDALRSCTNWQFHLIEGGHWPMLTSPRELSELLHSCVT